MLARPPKLPSYPLTVQRRADPSTSVPPVPATSPAARPRLEYGSLPIHSPSGRAGPAHPTNQALPAPLKRGVEILSGVSMDGVTVHRKSPHPAKLDAQAFTRGSEIHLAPGQDRHLPHEAWHVVQQAQGRVRPTMQMKGGARINDDAGLEREADEMGARADALQRGPTQPKAAAARPATASTARRGQPRAAAAAGGGSSAVVQCQNGDDDKKKTLFQTFAEGAQGGFSSFFKSLTNVAKPQNYQAAKEQGSQLLDVARRPFATAKNIASDVKPHLSDLDPKHSLARTTGDLTGSAAGLTLSTILFSLLAKKPYLATRPVQSALKKYQASPYLQHPILQHPKVKNFLLTRPLSALVGTGLGAASFYGSASTRESDAVENRQEHPNISAALEKSNVHKLFASQLNLAVKNRLPIRRENL